MIPSTKRRPPRVERLEILFSNARDSANLIAVSPRSLVSPSVIVPIVPTATGLPLTANTVTSKARPSMSLPAKKTLQSA